VGAQAPRAAQIDHVPGEDTWLASIAGYVDTLGFVALFGLFTAHVTGNFILIGSGLAGAGSGLLIKWLAFPAFVAGIVLARVLDNQLLARGHGVRACALYVLQAALLTGFMAAGVLAAPITNSDAPLTIAWSSAVADGPGWRLQFAEIPDRTAAEALMGRYLEVDAGPSSALPRGAYFWHEVIGTPVTSTTGEALGTVRDVYRSGGAEVYIVDGGPYGEFDVPGVRDFVRIFAPRRGEIVVDTAALDLGPPARGPGRAGTEPRPRAPRRRPGSRRRTATP